MEFSLRPYTESDAAPCGECLYEGFFTGPIDENDRRFLREYAQVLIEKCNFTYVAETEAGQGLSAASTASPSPPPWPTDTRPRSTMASGAACFSSST